MVELLLSVTRVYALVIFSFVLHHRVEDDGEFLSRGNHCLKLSTSGFAVPEVISERVLCTVQCIGALSEHKTNEILPFGNFAREQLTTGYLSLMFTLMTVSLEVLNPSRIL